MSPAQPAAAARQQIARELEASKTQPSSPHRLGWEAGMQRALNILREHGVTTESEP